METNYQRERQQARARRMQKIEIQELKIRTSRGNPAIQDWERSKFALDGQRGELSDDLWESLDF
jgi:hypothetical protein